MGKKWIPLEANPEVLSEYARRIGVSGTSYEFTDVYGLEEDLLAMVPRPVAAVLLLFPITKSTEAARKQEQQEIEARGQQVSPSVFYMKQTIGNACGTIGLLHAAANNREELGIAEGSFLQQFLAATEGLSPAQRGAYLEQPPEGAPDIDCIHQAAAQQGDTTAPSAEVEVDLHFVTFICKDGCIYELDGRKACPINHGACSPDRLLETAAGVVRSHFMERANSIQFNMIALATTSDSDS